MRTHLPRTDNKLSGQSMVEFAIVLPILLLILFGIIEFGHLLFVYSSVVTASREAARYGSAAGSADGWTPYYLDCDGIRETARRTGILANIQDENIAIMYDDGVNTYSTTCPPSDDVHLADRIVI
ncbi:MAG: hypothetical protein GXP40_07040, partial [Chloroflexi bacterium]|nr:hypothetical protein [Chloroflexota bacterium]